MVPEYPQFKELTLDMKSFLQPLLKQHNEGISEFTFSGIFLFRKEHNYKISQLDDKCLILIGNDDGKPFFMLPAIIPKKDTLNILFKDFKSIKGVSQSKAAFFVDQGYKVAEDRDNFDYLYLRTDLAKLPGKKYHKKRNHVHIFLNNYSYQGKPFLPEYREHALSILEGWSASQKEAADYAPTKEALENFEELELCGALYYVEDEPAAFIIGEELVKDNTYVIHYEKAIRGYRGIYQFVNKSFASLLPEKYEYINREQDLGNDGLRQAKLSYRPCGFIKKYRVTI